MPQGAVFHCGSQWVATALCVRAQRVGEALQDEGRETVQRQPAISGVGGEELLDVGDLRDATLKHDDRSRSGRGGRLLVCE